VDFYSASSPPFFAISLSNPLKRGGWTSILTLFGGSGVDFYSGLEQTRRVDLYWGGV